MLSNSWQKSLGLSLSLSLSPRVCFWTRGQSFQTSIALTVISSYILVFTLVREEALNSQ